MKVEEEKELKYDGRNYFGSSFIGAGAMKGRAEARCESDSDAPRTKVQRVDALDCDHR
ncbi:hypothetical protein [Salmonella enterica]|uniref:hypothetical protein n=1 Tax=Salmonella enterica TaxID=28901 RepID=UPI00398C7E6C